MTWIMLAVLAATLVSAFRPGHDLLSPSRIYICVYSLLLAIYHLNLSRLQSPWSASSNLLFYGASGLFLISGLWVWIFGKSSNPSWSLDFSRVRAELKADAETMDWRWFRRVYAVSVLIYVISFIVSAVVVRGIPAFMKEPDEARIKFFMASLPTNYGIFMGPISLMLGVILLAFSNPAKREKRLVLASLAMVLLMYLAIVTRYDLFRFIIFSVIVYHYGIRKMRPIHILSGFGLALSLFLIGFLIRVNTDSISAFNEMIKIKMPRHLEWASNIYAYLANDFWNFDFAIKRFVDGDREYPTQYGLGLFRALLANLRLDSPLIEAYHFDTLYNESATKVKGLNTVIYVWHLYKDFGPVGVLLLPMIAGLFVWKFYLSTLWKPTVFRIGIWGVLSGAIALSYHTPMWELWFLYLNILVFAIAHRKLTAV
jgi:oligosaccharide repeat unit polymerase